MTTYNPEATADPQFSPEAVAETIFRAARNGDFSGLAALIDAEADKDSRMIGSVAADPALQEEFKKHFSRGKVNGVPSVNGHRASVNILFGPDGDRQETFEMVQKEGKWYLQSF